MHFADALSCVHLTRTTPNNLFNKKISIAAIEYVDADLERLVSETEKDKTLEDMIKYLKQGWPTSEQEIPSCHL